MKLICLQLLDGMSILVESWHCLAESRHWALPIVSLSYSYPSSTVGLVHCRLQAMGTEEKILGLRLVNRGDWARRARTGGVDGMQEAHSSGGHRRLCFDIDVTVPDQFCMELDVGLVQKCRHELMIIDP